MAQLVLVIEYDPETDRSKTSSQLHAANDDEYPKLWVAALCLVREGLEFFDIDISDAVKQLDKINATTQIHDLRDD